MRPFKMTEKLSTVTQFLTVVPGKMVFPRTLKHIVHPDYQPLRNKVYRVEQGILVVVKAPTLMKYGKCREE